MINFHEENCIDVFVVTHLNYLSRIMLPGDCFCFFFFFLKNSPKSVKNLEWSKSLPYLQANELAWQFQGCWQRNWDLGAKTNRSLLLHGYSSRQGASTWTTSLSLNSHRVVPVHAMGHITTEESLSWGNLSPLLQSGILSDPCPGGRHHLYYTGQ